jgi:hypothetical protein
MTYLRRYFFYSLLLISGDFNDAEMFMGGGGGRQLQYSKPYTTNCSCCFFKVLNFTWYNTTNINVQIYIMCVCAAHVCTLFSSTANLRESYGSYVYQRMQSSREEMWVGPSVTAR